MELAEHDKLIMVKFQGCVEYQNQNQHNHQHNHQDQHQHQHQHQHKHQHNHQVVQQKEHWSIVTLKDSQSAAILLMVIVDEVVLQFVKVN